MSIIRVNGIKIYAHHGCLPEEAVIGGEYVVNVSIDTDFSKAAQTDELHDTVDYCVVFECVKKEMAVRSKLIEHVAQRIVNALRHAYPSVKTFSVEVVKIVPPMNGAVESVSVIING